MVALEKLRHAPVHFTVWTVTFTVLVAKITVRTVKSTGAHRNFLVSPVLFPHPLFIREFILLQQLRILRCWNRGIIETRSHERWRTTCAWLPSCAGKQTAYNKQTIISINLPGLFAEHYKETSVNIALNINNVKLIVTSNN